MTLRHERRNGEIVEYRRHPYDSAILHMEGRVLRPDGTPFDDRWYRTSDSEMLNLQESGSDIVQLLSSAEGR